MKTKKKPVKHARTQHPLPVIDDQAKLKRIELFCQPGAFGIHAGTRPSSRSWGAHATDAATAAYRAALRFWFGPGKDKAYTVQQHLSLQLTQVEPQRFVAVKTDYETPKSPELLKSERKNKFFGQKSKD